MLSLVIFALFQQAKRKFTHSGERTVVFNSLHLLAQKPSFSMQRFGLIVPFQLVYARSQISHRAYRLGIFQSKGPFLIVEIESSQFFGHEDCISTALLKEEVAEYMIIIDEVRLLNLKVFSIGNGSSHMSQ